MEWIEDASGNKCSVEYFGTRKAAQGALNSLNRCKNCTNCSRCSDCSDCSRCSDCYDCSDCSRCFRCSRCSRCSDCSDCSRCSDCYDCSDCSGCFRCSRCSDCYGCFDCYGCYDCSGCSDCSGCFRCSDCYGCSNVASLRQKKDLKGDSESAWIGSPPIPKIENIHKQIYDAASIPPEALEMGSCHTCGTTHCRGGWAVHLAGQPGYDLEKFHGTLLAAQLIYRESGYAISPCRFFDTNEDALADMKRLAEGVTC